MIDLTEVALGWIVPPTFRQLTPNRYSPKFQARRCLPVELVVYHFTAGGFDGSLRWLTSRDSSASAHFIVRKNGEIWQLCPLQDRTWHAGGASSIWRKGGQVNNRSIGIEIENWGKLKKLRGEVTTYRDVPYKGTYVQSGDDLWDAYPEAQMLGVIELTKALVAQFPILANDAGPPNGRLTGHQHIDPTRKSDPGHAFPWTHIIEAARTRV